MTHCNRGVLVHALVMWDIALDSNYLIVRLRMNNLRTALYA